eukprot:620404-Pelagomonas_calceolata.AAC.1
MKRKARKTGAGTTRHALDFQGASGGDCWARGSWEQEKEVTTSERNCIMEIAKSSNFATTVRHAFETLKTRISQVHVCMPEML